MEQKAVYIQKQRYKFFAYKVIRDAIGFYFGIPKFFKENDIRDEYKSQVACKLESIERNKGRKPTDREVAKCQRIVLRALNERIAELKTDFAYSKDVLFNNDDNIWLQHLELNGEFFKSYLDGLPEDTKDELAVIPKWSTRDHSLGRSYINDDFGVVKLF